MTNEKQPRYKVVAEMQSTDFWSVTDDGAPDDWLWDNYDYFELNAYFIFDNELNHLATDENNNIIEGDFDELTEKAKELNQNN